MTSTSRPTILVLNQYYWPGVEATAQLLSQLCEALAADYDVTVVTGHLHGLDLPTEEELVRELQQERNLLEQQFEERG